MWWMMNWGWPWMLAGVVYWLVSLAFILWALVGLAGAKKDAGYKLIWAAIVVFLGVFGVLLYYLLNKK